MTDTGYETPTDVMVLEGPDLDTFIRVLNAASAHFRHEYDDAYKVKQDSSHPEWMHNAAAQQMGIAHQIGNTVSRWRIATTKSHRVTLTFEMVDY